jgi:hypothetical protein
MIDLRESNSVPVGTLKEISQALTVFASRFRLSGDRS